MPGRWPRRLLILLAALAAAESGHLLTYLVRFGPGALRIESGDSHSYLPALSVLLTGAVGSALVLVGLVIALARQVGSGAHSRRGIPFINLASLLLVLQFTIFVTQETGEALAAQGSLPSASDLAFWGILGQLPAALLAALIVRRPLAEVEVAVEILADGPALQLGLRRLAAVGFPVSYHRPQLSSRPVNRSNPRRGPPLSI